jgi:hypothetical protein
VHVCVVKREKLNPRHEKAKDEEANPFKSKLLSHRSLKRWAVCPDACADHVAKALLLQRVAMCAAYRHLGLLDSRGIWTFRRPVLGCIKADLCK